MAALDKPIRSVALDFALNFGSGRQLQCLCGLDHKDNQEYQLSVRKVQSLSEVSTMLVLISILMTVMILHMVPFVVGGVEADDFHAAAPAKLLTVFK